jgi:DNA polymerase elongation subunit (family B)
MNISNARILLFDLETAPTQAYVWGLWQQNVGINQIERDWYILCWAAKWFGSDVVHTSALPDFRMEYAENPHNDMEVVRRLHEMLDHADIVIAHNAAKFDVRKIQAKFLEHNLPPVSPFKIIDTLKVMKKEFALSSNKLDYVAQLLDIGEKIDTGGFELWDGCMKGDKESWKKMVEYNVHDVWLLEEVYKKLRPWIRNHPNVNLYDMDETQRCPVCGGTHSHKRGTYQTSVGVYTRYKCQSCGSWHRERTMSDIYTKEKRKSITRIAYQ